MKKTLTLMILGALVGGSIPALAANTCAHQRQGGLFADGASRKKLLGLHKSRGSAPKKSGTSDGKH